MLLAELCATSEEVGGTRSRKKKLAALASCLRSAKPDEVEVCVCYLSGVMRQGRIGLGYAAISGLDAGPAQSEPVLEVLQLDRILGELKALSGKGSQTQRLQDFAALLARATAPEQAFIRRLVVGEVRQGALEGLMMEAVALASELDADRVRRAAMLSGDLAAVALAAFTEGASGLEKFRLEVGRPVQPMLAQTATSVEDALGKLDTGAGGANLIAPADAPILEYKLDGARVQVHRAGSVVKVFTRQLHDVTAAVPEVVEAALGMSGEQFVLDGEVLALRADGRPHPFQTTMKRFGRRLQVDEMRKSLPLSVFFFDCLHWAGRDVLDDGADARATLMDEVLPARLVIPRKRPKDQEDAEFFLDEALRAGHEGLMAKTSHAPYQAGRRGADWLKIKPAHTLDLVVIGVDWGSGRRQGWLSNLHLAARDEGSGQFVMLGKTFKGMTDELLIWQTEALGALKIHDDGWTVTVRPERVVEIAFDGVQESPHYPGGFALRFARVKGYRHDKKASEADTLQSVRRIFDEGRR